MTQPPQSSEKLYKIAKPIPQGKCSFSIVESTVPGLLGGTRSGKLYGRLNCQSALRWLAKGHYAKSRVFFHSEKEAIACGFRPCYVCMRTEYDAWKARETG